MTHEGFNLRGRILPCVVLWALLAVALVWNTTDLWLANKAELLETDAGDVSRVAASDDDPELQRKIPRPMKPVKQVMASGQKWWGGNCEFAPYRYVKQESNDGANDDETGLPFVVHVDERAQRVDVLSATMNATDFLFTGELKSVEEWIPLVFDHVLDGHAAESSEATQNKHKQRIVASAPFFVERGGTYVLRVENVGENDLECRCHRLDAAVTMELRLRRSALVASAAAVVSRTEPIARTNIGGAALRFPFFELRNQAFFARKSKSNPNPESKSSSDNDESWIHDGTMWRWGEPAHAPVLTRASAAACLRGKTIHFMGDSTTRQLAVDLHLMLTDELISQQKGTSVQLSDGTRMHLQDQHHRIWYISGNITTPSSSSDESGRGDHSAQRAQVRAERTSASDIGISYSATMPEEAVITGDLIVANYGAHYVARGAEIYDCPPQTRILAARLGEYRRKNPDVRLLYRTTYAVEHQVRSCMSAARVQYLNIHAMEIMRHAKIPVLDVTRITSRREECSDGVHRHLCSVSREVLKQIMLQFCQF